MSAVYIADLDTQESLTLIKAINAAEEAVLGMLILLGIKLLDKYFDNNI
jgi:hypothetical protein